MGMDDCDPAICGEARVNEYLYDLIKELGLEPIVQKTALDGRDNIGAMIYKGDNYKTIILQSHTDTVGIGDNRALLNPVEKDGRIYGRGACDCKGGLAAMFVALAEAAKHPEQVKNNIIAMGVSDEEYSFKGSLELGKKFPTKCADFGIIGEPTECRIINGFKGVARWDVFTTGKAFHSSEPEKGINAVYRMARIVNMIEKYQSGLSKGETISVGTIRGGSAVNIVPDSCEIEIDRRLTEKTLPHEASNDLEKYLKQNLDFDFSFSDLKDAQNAVSVDKCHPGVKMMSGVCSGMELDPMPGEVAFGSDAYRMNAAGIPTILWGPGSIANAHIDGEFVGLGELKNAKNFYLNVIKSDMRDYNKHKIKE
jgi:acetylornithine deacetylase